MRAGLSSRIGDLLGGGIFLVLGLAFAGFVASGILDSVRLRLQPPTRFAVVQTEIVPTDLGRGGFDLVIRFRQPGRTEVERAELHEDDYRDLARIQRTLPPGTPVLGRRLPPDSPAQLDLVEPGWRSLLGLPLLAFPLVFVAVGGWIAWGGITGKEWRKRGGNPEAAPWILMVAGTVFLLMGTVAVAGIGILPVRDWFRSRDWVPTPATIEMSRSIVSRTGKGGRSWHPEVLYRYVWNGETHRSSKIGPGRKDSESETDRFVRRHPPGSTTTCLVNPADPTEAFLGRALSPWSLVALVFLLFPAAGVALLRAGWRSRSEAPNPPRQRGTPGRFGLLRL